MNSEMIQMPAIALRGMTVLPSMIVHFDVSREKSVRALDAALSGDDRVFLVTQKDISTAVPTEAELYSVGTVCTIRQILRIPGGGMIKVMVEACIPQASSHRSRILPECRMALSGSWWRGLPKPS